MAWTAATKEEISNWFDLLTIDLRPRKVIDLACLTNAELLVCRRMMHNYVFYFVKAKAGVIWFWITVSVNYMARTNIEGCGRKWEMGD